MGQVRQTGVRPLYELGGAGRDVPAAPAVAVCVKLSSPGPVFFRQTRLGPPRLPFTVTKFRTMTVGSEAASAGEAAPEMDDPDRPLHELRNKKDETCRITRFGALLRRTGIDEIPQFINVFKGDMSVVGPARSSPASRTSTGGAHAGSTCDPASPACGRSPGATT